MFICYISRDVLEKLINKEAHIPKCLSPFVKVSVGKLRSIGSYKQTAANWKTQMHLFVYEKTSNQHLVSRGC